MISLGTCWLSPDCSLRVLDPTWNWIILYHNYRKHQKQLLPPPQCLCQTTDSLRVPSSDNDTLHFSVRACAFHCLGQEPLPAHSLRNMVWKVLSTTREQSEDRDSTLTKHNRLTNTNLRWDYGILLLTLVISYLSPLCAKGHTKCSVYIVSLHPPKMSMRLKSYTVFHQSRRESKRDSLLCTEFMKIKRREKTWSHWSRSARWREENYRPSINTYDHLLCGRFSSGSWGHKEDSDMSFTREEFKGDF